ncbi:hypothetical protein BDV24DRAFT_156207 [Aspergillus arachidicola]|uniref:endo-1,3(4)-beta-glucanase n=1 Tax=Aspergillus arachidicola TaxID=656916 RepID=A0A5N6XPT3_9EURO|nr:hypothetical protein BDV24DRAFT_156207 [Aspergillus arachidicola]
MTFILESIFIGLACASYVLQDDFGTSDAFFDNFTFFTDADPTHGFVNYVDHATAKASGLIRAENQMLYLGVDHTHVSPSSGRPSVRLTSVKSFKYGLFVLDLKHMPGSICGTWPAFWLVGADWPTQGEIDIIEGANQKTTNMMTLHTPTSCMIDNGDFSGTLASRNCYYADAGCSINVPSDQSFGSGLNQAGGGVYAVQWTERAIVMWFFPRNQVPSELVHGSESIDPTSWGTPTAKFAGQCDLASQLGPQQIVINTAFCGDWAGQVWPSSSCAKLGSTCDDYVAKNPSAFGDTYWEIQSLKVYQEVKT